MTENSVIEPPAPRYKTSGKIKFILVVSLALNLLVVGMVAGMMFNAGGMPHADRHVRDYGFKTVINALSRSDRAQLSHALRKEFGAKSAQIPKARKQISALIQSLETTDFNNTRVESILRSEVLNIVPRQEAGLRLLIEKVNAMTPKQRQEYASRLKMAMGMDMTQQP